MSRLQEIVENATRRWFPAIPTESNHRPPWLYGMEIDIFVPSLKFGIEVNGYQHAYWIPALQPSWEAHMKQRERDAQKKLICARMGIKLFQVTCKIRGLEHLHKKLRRHFGIVALEPWINKEWVDHYTFLRHRYTGTPRIKLKHGVPVPKNKASIPFVPRSGINEPVCTKSDNLVPCNAPF